MSIYAVGDLQGCLTPLQDLLQQASFNPQKDQLWCAGDVVNRGPESLPALRFLYQMRDCCTVTLGNHDLHLLAVAYGGAQTKKSDTLDDILNAPDRDELLHWLRQQPLLHQGQGYTMVHAGIAPQWSLKKAIKLAREVETVLRGKHYLHYFQHLYGNTPDIWDNNLEGMDRLRAITNYFTHMRYFYADGRMDFKCKIGPADAPAELTPWYLLPRKAAGEKLIFGHWASLLGECPVPELYALDTGCVWGGQLTMLRLADDEQPEAWFHSRCKQQPASE